MLARVELDIKQFAGISSRCLKVYEHLENVNYKNHEELNEKLIKIISNEAERRGYIFFNDDNNDEFYFFGDIIIIKSGVFEVDPEKYELIKYNKEM